MPLALHPSIVCSTANQRHVQGLQAMAGHVYFLKGVNPMTNSRHVYLLDVCSVPLNVPFKTETAQSAIMYNACMCLSVSQEYQH